MASQAAELQCKIASDSKDKKDDNEITEVAILKSQIMKAHNFTVQSIAVGIDNDTVVFGGADNNVHVGSLKTGLCIQELKGHKSHINCIAFAKDNDTIVSGSMYGTIGVWSRKGLFSYFLAQGSNVLSVAVRLG